MPVFLQNCDLFPDRDWKVGRLGDAFRTLDFEELRHDLNVIQTLTTATNV